MFISFLIFVSNFLDSANTPTDAEKSLNDGLSTQTAVVQTNIIAEQNNYAKQNANMPAEQVETETQRFMQKVYGWMFVALMISGVTAFAVSANQKFLEIIFPYFNILLIVELILVVTLSFLAKKVNALVATILFVFYSFITGLTLSVIFLVYQISSIVSVFGATALIFGAMSLYGYTTKKDLTTIGTIAIFGLLGIIVASLVNLFVGNTLADTVIAGIGVLVFVVLTAYDTQKIKEMNLIGNEGGDEDKKEAIIGALTLYLDFINLFLKLLRLFGKRK